MKSSPKATRWITPTRKFTGLVLLLAAMASPARAQVGVECKRVPEIDLGSCLSALTLMGGGLLLLTDRRSR